VILADEMGLGKTIQTIAFLGALWKVRPAALRVAWVAWVSPYAVRCVHGYPAA
jgi:SNF2 family DNA or RNA helicase